jgi:ATP-dependent DNA helicase RecQ
METPLTILQRYWKHGQFRPLQEDIIRSVMEGKDTLALLPTGGGKSVCFQVPALLTDGLCIVITPLIALMNDQVEQLKKRGIQAVAIHSSMSRRQIDLYLDNCLYGKVKFLYISPERIQTEMFRERVKHMNVSLIAVDEAHCISQWGYDFRPPYLKITALRDLVPRAPVIALTATATKDVQDDIIAKLNFHAPFGSFRRTFARENLSIVVRKTENKEKKLIDILSKVKGSAIVYVRSRKGTQEISGLLNKNGIQSTYYHAGLPMEDRVKGQRAWINNEVRVMVATNAFGMGIDKADVRLVVHLDLPENVESYYQEAGRAGRDSHRAYAAIIYQDADVSALILKMEQSHPSISDLKQVYQALANYYQLATGSGEGESYDFDIHAFADRFHYSVHEVYNALKKLEEEGLVVFSESFYSPSQLYITIDAVKLYQFQVANSLYDPVLKMILRLYGGELFSGYVRISEAYLARAQKNSIEETTRALRHLDQLKIVSYRPAKDQPQLTFVLPRQDAERLPLDKERLERRRKLTLSKMNSLIRQVTSNDTCRMMLIQDYFGEHAFEECQICDVCVARRKRNNLKEADTLRHEINHLLDQKRMSIEQLEEQIAPEDHELFVDIIREMVDEGEISYDEVWQLMKV